MAYGLRGSAESTYRPRGEPVGTGSLGSDDLATDSQSLVVTVGAEATVVGRCSNDASQGKVAGVVSP